MSLNPIKEGVMFVTVIRDELNALIEAVNNSGAGDSSEISRRVPPWKH